MRNDMLVHSRHAELALTMASRDQRLLNLLAQRPHLLNPYPSIITRLSRRSRRFRLRQRRISSPRPIRPGGREQ